MLLLAAALTKERLQKQGELDEELSSEKHRNEVQNRLIDQLGDKIKAVQRQIDELQNRQREEQRKLNNANDALEKERRGAEQDGERNISLSNKLQELKVRYQKQLQDDNFDDIDNQIKVYHEGVRADLYQLTTGELYERWKNGIVDDNVSKAQLLTKQGERSVEIAGKQPEVKFDEQKSENISMRGLFLEAIKKDYTQALEKEKQNEREIEAANRQLGVLRKTRDRRLGEITETNIDPSSSRLGELSKAVRSVVLKSEEETEQQRDKRETQARILLATEEVIVLRRQRDEYLALLNSPLEVPELDSSKRDEYRERVRKAEEKIKEL